MFNCYQSHLSIETGWTLDLFNFQNERMSIFNILSIRKTFQGCIKINNNNFGYFSVNERKVTHDLASSFILINENLWKKKIRGQIIFCEFENHDGKQTTNTNIQKFLFSSLGAHISLWMDSEQLEDSALSISSFAWEVGEFYLRQFRIKKNGTTILLVGNGGL